jgi:hypothetical protein
MPQSLGIEALGIRHCLPDEAWEHDSVNMNKRFRLEIPFDKRRKISGKESRYYREQCKDRKEHIKHTHPAPPALSSVWNDWLYL